MANEQATRTLVVGIGNILLRDEGVGVRVIEAMQKMGLGEQLELLDGGTSGVDLIDQVAGRLKVIVVDAVQTDEKPGTIVRFEAEALAASSQGKLSLHELGLLETLAMARDLGCPPKRVVVFGIQPKDISMGLELSPEVAQVVPKVIDLVLAEARR